MSPPRTIDDATERQQRATAPMHSVWVSASAGTGKTKVLTDRVLSLLLQGTPPNRLLCLTFTKAAAAEMMTRVVRRLSDWATVTDERLRRDLAELSGREPEAHEMVRARQLFATVLDAPGGLKIQTIHAFCQSLLARFPLEAEIAPHFAVMDEATAEELRREARETVLAQTRSHDLGGLKDPALSAALATVTDHVQEKEFGELLAQLTSERGRIGRLIGMHRGVERLIAAIAVRIGMPPDVTPDVVRDELATPDATVAADLRRAAEALSHGRPTDRERGIAIARFVERRGGRDEAYAAHRAAFLTKEGGVRKSLVTKDCLAAAPFLRDILDAEAARLMRLEERLRSAVILASTAALLRLGAALLDAYEAAKRRRVALDYDDLILKTRDLLRSEGGSSWVLYKLDGGLDHILIDEAQDTNPEQWEVVQALAEEFFAGEGVAARPRTIFAVGDAKQSIFSFQRADPLAFERMRAHFRQRVSEARQEWLEIPLEKSFRSTSAVLEAVDAVFAEPAARDGVVGDTRLSHEVSRLGHAGVVELWPLGPLPPASQAGDWQPPLIRETRYAPLVQAARLVAAHIQDLCGTTLESRGRKISPGDFLVLVRRRTGFVEELVRALKERRIAVAGVDRMVLTDQLAVMDLIALGRFLLLPGDDLTLACVLKSPLIGLDEAALFGLAYDRRPLSLWTALQRRAEDDARYGAARDYLAGLLAAADFTPPFELFSRVLARDGGRAKLLARLGEEANDPIDEFLAQCLVYERDHVPSLEGFLHWLEHGGLQIKRDSDVGARDEVRIMTVHGAKGLQAPIVILADTMQKPVEHDRLLWPDDGWGPIWVPRVNHADATAARLRRTPEVARDREYRRLLYVAMTRAEDRLYVVGWPSRKAEPADCWYRLVEAGLRVASGTERVAFDFGRLGFTDWRGDGWRLAHAQSAPPVRGEDLERTISAEHAFPAWVREPPAPEPVAARPLAPSRPSEPPPVRSPLGDDDGRQFVRGRLIHRLLQTLPDLAPARRADAGRRFLARGHLGLSPDEQTAWLAETLRVMDEPAFAALFGPGSRAEVPLVGRLGAVVVAGQIDRLAVTDAAVLILDYKTNRPPPARVEAVAPVYLSQLATYRALVRQIYPNRPVRAALLWTDRPSLMAVPEALLDELATKIGAGPG
ncbi:MAG: double-strand break repair helicase AddA [Proteobacteria bacterium]|nr:double-strand break repair helicase AddA [Pseudomonadota bacterium]